MTAGIDSDNLMLVLIAIMNMVSAFLAWKTHTLATATQHDVALVEKATNSMKDALVAATDKAAHAQGLSEGRAEGVKKAESLVEEERHGNVKL